jgi:hypothetical protein
MIQDPEFAGQVTDVKKLGPEGDPLAASCCLLLGIIALFTWMVPALGMAAPLAGLACGRRGWRASNHHRAEIGVWMCVISLVLGLIVYYLYFLAIDASARSPLGAH